MHARVVLGVGNGVLFREVSSVLGCPHFRMHARVVLVVGNGVLLREVSCVLISECMQEWYLWWEMVSCLERCPVSSFQNACKSGTCGGKWCPV